MYNLFISLLPNHFLLADGSHDTLPRSDMLEVLDIATISLYMMLRKVGFLFWIGATLQDRSENCSEN